LHCIHFYHLHYHHHHCCRHPNNPCSHTYHHTKKSNPCILLLRTTAITFAIIIMVLVPLMLSRLTWGYRRPVMRPPLSFMFTFSSDLTLNHSCGHSRNCNHAVALVHCAWLCPSSHWMHQHLHIDAHTSTPAYRHPHTNTCTPTPAHWCPHIATCTPPVLMLAGCTTWLRGHAFVGVWICRFFHN
jgi:hypothetical protein